MKYFQYFRSNLTLREGVLLFTFLGIAIAAVVFLTTKESQQYGSDKVGLPPLIRTREEIYDYYKLRFLQDGYPGRQMKNKIVPHPLYGAYVIRDYLNQYDSTKDEKYLKAAITVAKASLGRMEKFKDALVFWYNSDMGISSSPARFYSGLTQSRYLVLFGQLFKLTNDPLFLKSSIEILESLFIKQSDGGVLKQFHSGVSIEEVPNEIPLYTLNGWLTAIINVKLYADEVNSERAQELFSKNVDSVERIIDLYDVEEIASSRYHLSGLCSLKLRFLNGFRPIIIRGSVKIPKEGKFPIKLQQNKNLYSNYIKDKKHININHYTVTTEEVETNLVLSMISFPEENSVSIELETSAGGEMEVLIGVGEYDPFSNNLRPTRWISLGKFNASKSTPKIWVTIPWRKAWFVAYPTNFMKKIGGRNYNVYHYIHIKRLKTLHDYTKREKFNRYYLKWFGYTKQWPEMEPYKSEKIEFHGLH
jgi:hypothetical protein